MELAALKKIAPSNLVKKKKIVRFLNLFMSRTTTAIKTSCILILEEKIEIAFLVPLVNY